MVVHPIFGKIEGKMNAAWRTVDCIAAFVCLRFLVFFFQKKQNTRKTDTETEFPNY